MNMFLKNNLLFFDDDCILCNKSIRFIHFLDTHHKIFFTPLQSPLGIEIQQEIHLKEQNSSVVYHRNRKLHTQSNAILYCLSDLHWFLKPLLLFLLIPPIIRNTLYNFVAKNRKKLFKNATCSVPSESLRKQLI